ncbi:hypothetical protein V8G54_012755 [Vigna mungo]|uniref:Uncharacterized protein n=1 Tax=Vigna mungo TaxID=3915 RepID=A0AAQ3S0X4_VIGMU
MEFGQDNIVLPPPSSPCTGFAIKAYADEAPVQTRGKKIYDYASVPSELRETEAVEAEAKIPYFFLCPFSCHNKHKAVAHDKVVVAPGGRVLANKEEDKGISFSVSGLVAHEILEGEILELPHRFGCSREKKGKRGRGRSSGVGRRKWYTIVEVINTTSVLCSAEAIHMYMPRFCSPPRHISSLHRDSPPSANIHRMIIAKDKQNGNRETQQLPHEVSPLSLTLGQGKTPRLGPPAILTTCLTILYLRIGDHRMLG